MPAHQANHAREKELRCIPTEVVQEPGSSLDLLMEKTVQNSMHLPHPMTSFGCGWVRPLPVASFVRCRFCRSPCVLPRLSGSCASCPLLCQILSRFPCFLCPPIHQPSSILLHQCCNSRLFEMSLNRSISSGDDCEFAPIPLQSPLIHGFLHHLTLFLSLSSPSDSLDLLLSLSGSAMFASCVVEAWVHGSKCWQPRTHSIRHKSDGESKGASAQTQTSVPRQKAVRELDFFDVNPRVCSQNSTGSWTAKMSRRAIELKLLPFATCPLRRLWKWWSSTLLHMRHLLSTEHGVPGTCGTCSHG